MDYKLIISLLFGITSFLLINIIFDLKIFQGILEYFIKMVEIIVDHIGNYNTKRYIERVKKDKIIRYNENVIAKYNRIVENLILDFNLPLTLESFNTLLSICAVITIFIIVIFIKNITMSVVMTISIFIGLFTLFILQSKNIKAERLENIMDAEDIICPLARDGVFNAIKKVMKNDEYINPNIRPYFQQFINNYEHNGYSFRQAITILNRQLGYKFNNFTKKAIVFEYNERKGMSDIFLDIVDENAVLREINARKDRIFRKMNRDFLIKTAMIIAFFLYASSVKEFSVFMFENDFGKLINTVMISTICISFARSQVLQSGLGNGGEGY